MCKVVLRASIVDTICGSSCSSGFRIALDLRRNLGKRDIVVRRCLVRLSETRHTRAGAKSQQ